MTIFINIKIDFPLILLFLHISSLSMQRIIPASDEFDRMCNIENWIDLDTLEGWNATQLETLDINHNNFRFERK